MLVETYDDLLENYREQVDRAQFASIRRRLTRVQKELTERSKISDMLDALCQTMAQARKRARRWHIDADGFDAFESGVRKSYKGAQRAMDAAARHPTPDAIHEWRKRVKDHWYQARLLCPIWRSPMKAHGDVAEQLADMLGKHHDLEVFRQRLTDHELGDATDVEVLVGLIRRRQKALEEKTFSTGARLLAEPADGLTRRWRCYWDAWRADEPREAALAA